MKTPLKRLFPMIPVLLVTAGCISLPPVVHVEHKTDKNQIQRRLDAIDHRLDRIEAKADQQTRKELQDLKSEVETLKSEVQN